MSTLTSILGTDLISNAPSVLNANFNALNLGVVGNSASIVSLQTSVASLSKISISSINSSLLAITTTATDKVIILARGIISGTTAAGSVAILYNGVIKDSIETKQAATADRLPFTLMYSETPGVATNNIVVSVIATGALVTSETRIIAQIIS